jgi:steroid 5-alpha reductase family enzyme
MAACLVELWAAQRALLLAERMAEKKVDSRVANLAAYWAETRAVLSAEK